MICLKLLPEACALAGCYPENPATSPIRDAIQGTGMRWRLIPERSVAAGAAFLMY